MKIFFDTNVLIAAFISHGTSSELFEYCLLEYTIYTSQWVLDEFRDKLLHKFHFPNKEVNQAIGFLRKNAAIITHPPLSSPVCRDPDDDNILAAIAKEKVDCLITGDKDLLILKHYQGIPILKPDDFWPFERKKLISMI